MNGLAGISATLTLAGLAISIAAPARAADDLCALLAPADFEAAGVTGTRAPTKNPDQNGAYCVYAGKSSATGGVEFDVFVTPNAAEGQAVYQEMRYSFPTTTAGPSVLRDADQVEVAKLRGPPVYTSIIVRKGKLVFGIGVPANARSQDAVIALARLVLQRADKLTR